MAVGMTCGKTVMCERDPEGGPLVGSGETIRIYSEYSEIPSGRSYMLTIPEAYAHLKEIPAEWVKVVATVYVVLPDSPP